MLVLRAAAVLLRVVGNATRQLCKVLTTVYDIFIVLPLLVERWAKSARSGGTMRARRGAFEAEKPT